MWYNADMKKELTKKQKGYVENVTKGISKERSAIMAGATINAVACMDASPKVQTEIARIRAEVLAHVGITREDIADMLMEAAGYARIIGDPMALIAAARELGKLLGHYAPEKKPIGAIDKNDLRKALKDMNDEDLFKLAHTKVIDGEFTRMSELPRPEEAQPVLPPRERVHSLHTGPGSTGESDLGREGQRAPSQEAPEGRDQETGPGEHSEAEDDAADIS